MSVFKKYSRYYDLLYKDKNYQAEVDYITNIIQKLNPNARTILDLGSGTGKHDYLLSKSGFKVKGVDLSPEMVEEANAKLENVYHAQKDFLSFEVGDIRSWELDEKYDVIISLFHVMSYQISNDDIMKALQTISKHLKQGGLVIFDFWYGPGVLSDRPQTRIKRLEDDSIKVTRFAESVIYSNENKVDVNYTIIINDKISNEVEEIKETHTMRYLFLPEMRLFLNSAGLTIVSEEAWVTGTELSFNNWNGCIICKKQ